MDKMEYQFSCLPVWKEKKQATKKANIMAF